MKDIKTKAALEKIAKAADVCNDVTLHARRNASKVKKRVQESTQATYESASEYGSEKYESSVETVITEAGHLVVHTARSIYQKDKKGVAQAASPEATDRADSTNPAPVSTQKSPVSQPQSKPSPSTKSAENTSVKTADRSVKRAQRTIKTAKETSAASAKAAQTNVKAAEKSVETAARSAVKAKRAAEATAAATAKGLKAAAEATVKAVKSIIAGIKALIAAIAAGGWVSVVIIVVILLVALLVGSVFGIFFAGEDTGSSMTMQNVVMEINRDYSDRIEAIKNHVAHDEIETTGTQADWPDTLAIYAVLLNSDPVNPTEVVTMDHAKKMALEGIFWDMNNIDYHTTSRTEITFEEVQDEEGNVQEVEVPITITTLHIQTSSKTATEMMEAYAFSEEQKSLLAELLKPEYEPLWAGVLYGVHNADGQIVAVALSQVGNVGGRPYWSWYGFGGRVEWCACFVSWCADQCGYIDAGIIPKFAGCGIGADWFIQRGQWADRNYIPQPGDIIFFDWEGDGSRDHVGIVEKSENGYVYTVEGNSGDRCAQRRYPVGWYQIKGYGLPAY